MTICCLHNGMKFEHIIESYIQLLATYGFVFHKHILTIKHFVSSLAINFVSVNFTKKDAKIAF